MPRYILFMAESGVRVIPGIPWSEIFQHLKPDAIVRITIDMYDPHVNGVEDGFGPLPAPAPYSPPVIIEIPPLRRAIQAVKASQVEIGCCYRCEWAAPDCICIEGPLFLKPCDVEIGCCYRCEKTTSDCVCVDASRWRLR